MTKRWRRIGAVGYLNSRPLVQGLDQSVLPLEVRFDRPSRCATLLHEGAIDIGLIPSIEYLARPDYAIVPGIAVACDGPVASVALFSKVPLDRIRCIALDTSSRTSAALLRILCAERFDIRPAFQAAAPDLASMLAQNDAALVIGDPALFIDPERLGLLKVDLGAAWKAHTGLPFVWACWVGRPGVLDDAVCVELARARDAGVAAIPAIALEFAKGDPRVAQVAEAYLRENVDFNLDDRREAALARFFGSAARVGVMPRAQELRFFGRDRQTAVP